MAWKPEWWGVELSVDLFNCNAGFIRDAGYIRQAVTELCELIGVRRFGDCQVVHFGDAEAVAGFSMVQLIETSLISGHFANASNHAYLNVFSCKEFDPGVASKYLFKTFKARQMRTKVNPRMGKFDMKAVQADLDATFNAGDTTREQVVGWLAKNAKDLEITVEGQQYPARLNEVQITGGNGLLLKTILKDKNNAGEQAGTPPTT